jgi:ribosomal protein L19E
MAEGRLPKITLKLMPKQKEARRRPKKNWMEGIRKTMNEKTEMKASGKIESNGV